MKNKYLEGKCICGRVKYKLSEKPLFTQACHCKDCKILTGSSYVVNSSVLENTLIIDGEISSSVELKGGSGAPCVVYYCDKCGTYEICFEKMYDPKITWPKKSLERYKIFLENKSQDTN
jgi:hypothetical protein